MSPATKAGQFDARLYFYEATSTDLRYYLNGLESPTEALINAEGYKGAADYLEAGPDEFRAASEEYDAAFVAELKKLLFGASK